MHYPIIALMHGSHGLSARRAWRTLSSSPEGPKAGPKSRSLEVGARRAPRLLVQYKGKTIMTQGVQLTWEEVCTGSGWKWTGPWNTSSIFILFEFLYQLFVKAYFMNFFTPSLKSLKIFIVSFRSKESCLIIRKLKDHILVLAKFSTEFGLSSVNRRSWSANKSNSVNYQIALLFRSVRTSKGNFDSLLKSANLQIDYKSLWDQACLT